MPLFCMCTAQTVELVEISDLSDPHIAGAFAGYTPKGDLAHGNTLVANGRPLVGVHLPEGAMQVEKTGANVFTVAVRRDEGPRVGDLAYAHYMRVDIHRCPRCGAAVASGG